MTALTLVTGTANYVTGLSNQAKGPGFAATTADDQSLYNMVAGTGTVTYEGWFKYPSAPSALEIIFSRTDIFWIGCEPSGQLASSIGSAGQQTALGTLADGNWHHVALVLAGNVFSLYLNGTRVQSYTSSGAFATSNPQVLTIGAMDASNGVYFTSSGYADEFAITSTAKYSGASFTVPTAPLPATAPGQVSLYRFDGNLNDSNVAAATGLTISGGSSSITVGTASSAFTVGANGGLTASTTVSLSDSGAGGTFSPTSLTLTSGATATFTYTPASAGSITLTASATGLTSATASLTATAAAPSANIAPNDANIIYSPGNWSVSSSAAETINDGAYFRTLINGSPTTITLLFNVSGETTTNMIGAYRVDGVGWTRFTVAAAVNLTLPAPSGVWTHRLVEFVYCIHDTGIWNTSEAVVFQGFATTPASCTTTAPAMRPLSGLVFGDSISHGVYTMHTSSTTYPADSDVTQAYSWNLQQALGAEVGICAFGGTDVNASYEGVPNTLGTYNLLWSGGPARNFAGLNFIVINLGTNNGGATASAYQTAYTTFLNDLLAATSTAHIFAMRPFNGAQASAIQAAVAGCSAPSRVTYVDTTGWWTSADSGDGTHPWGYSHMGTLTSKLADAMRPILSSGSVPSLLLW